MMDIGCEVKCGEDSRLTSLELQELTRLPDQPVVINQKQITQQKENSKKSSKIMQELEQLLEEL